MILSQQEEPQLEQIRTLIQGYKQEHGALVCLHCGQRFESELVYPIGDSLCLAPKAIREHLERSHGGPFAALLSLGNEAAGLPEVQARVLSLLYVGKDDAEIALELGGKASSTVRNHRYALRKREEEARVFLALMALLEGRKKGSRAEEEARFLDYPAGMPSRDERAATTEAEAALIEAKHLREDGGRLRLASWPKKQKEKLVLLRRIAELFEPGRSYAESEVNRLLAPVWEDHVTIRRYLIEYRFLERKPDGSDYKRR